MTDKDRRILGFDGLRAIAFLMVFISHKVPNGRLEAAGTMGVWVFFVLSGFLITRILARYREDIEARSGSFASALRAFFLSRAARIMPVYYVFLAVVTLLGFGGHIDAGEAGRQVANWLFMTNVYVEWNGWRTDLGHLWSLAVEEQFYLSFAPLVLVVPRRYLTALCLSLVAASMVAHLVLWMRGAWLVSFDVNTLANFGLLALGGWAGLAADRPLPPWMRANLTILGVLVAVVVLPLLLARTGLWPVVGRLSGVLVALLLTQLYQSQNGLAVRLLDKAWIREIGLVSYGAYLFHPVIHSEQLLPLLGISAGLPRQIAIVLDMGLTLMLAELSWRLFERPVGALLRSPRRAAGHGSR